MLPEMTASHERSARSERRSARRKVAQFAVATGLGAAMVAALLNVGVVSASANSREGGHSSGGGNSCSFSWGGHNHREGLRSCGQNVTGVVGTVGSNTFTLTRPGYGAPTTTTSTTPTSTTTTVAPTTTTVPTNCTTSTTGETQLSESGFLASTNAPSNSTDAPQNAITNAVNGTDSTRFSTDEAQALGLSYQVNMGAAQTFNEIQMATPNSSNDYARGYNIEVSSNGTVWTTIASCTGTATPEIVSFPTQIAQYLAVVLTTGAAGGWYWSIDQFFVYNTTPSTTTSTTVAPTTTTVAPGVNGTWTVNVNGSTRYRDCGVSSPGFGNVTSGEDIAATGYRAGPATIDATSITIKSSTCSDQGYGHSTTTTSTVPVTTTSTTYPNRYFFG